HCETVSRCDYGDQGGLCDGTLFRRCWRGLFSYPRHCCTGKLENLVSPSERLFPPFREQPRSRVLSAHPKRVVVAEMFCSEERTQPFRVLPLCATSRPPGISRQQLGFFVR